FLPVVTMAQSYQFQPVSITTRWAKAVSPANALKEYPRPQLERKNLPNGQASWVNLNGLWDYAISDSVTTTPAYAGKILVPYPLESSLSGIKKALQPAERLWYKKVFTHNSNTSEKTILHFGAVDYQCWIYLNGKEIGIHEGGYTAFSFDITPYIRSGENELVVKVYDPSDAGIGPRGKQVLNPANIYYTSSSGIWQTVWLESVPEKYITQITITPNIDKSSVAIKVGADTDEPITITLDGKTTTGNANQLINIPIKKARLWSPADPYLYDLDIKMGKDQVKSYFGMRKVSVQKDAQGHERIFLNNQPYFNLGVLDQGFWPDGLHTAPTDEALRFDIEAIKSMGFNTIRKHIKIEPARWYYHADKLGMLVWQDFVQPNPRLPEGAKQIFEKQGAEMMAQLYNHPSITTWVLFNEKWGAYDQQRLTEWVKKTDPTRLVNGHSGEILYVNEKLRSPSPNAYVSADITDVHSYPDPMNSLAMPGKARVLGEFGGIGVFIPGHQWNTNSAWGYINVTPAALKAKYQVMNQHLQLLEKEGLSASIYTQPFDVEGEQNGLMTYDREVIKIPFGELRKIHEPLNPGVGEISRFLEMSVKNADLTEPTQVYANLMQSYLNGKRDDQTLKALTQLAIQNNDAAGKQRFGQAYISMLSKPYSADDLAFLEGSTKKVTDPGFQPLIQHLQQNTNRPLHVKLMNMVYADLIAPAVPNAQAKPNWDEIAEKVKPYGAVGEEMLLRAKTVHTYNQKDWAAFVPTAKAYTEKYGSNLKPEELKQFKEAIAQHQ
ncbi:MAG: glycoside hydrolase family 2 protein, partial [Sediminibacterium sp.]